MLLISMPSAYEMIFICIILVCIQTYIFWKNINKKRILIGVLFSIVFSIITIFLLNIFLPMSLWLLLICAVVSSYICNSIYKAIIGDKTPLEKYQEDLKINNESELLKNKDND